MISKRNTETIRAMKQAIREKQKQVTIEAIKLELEQARFDLNRAESVKFTDEDNYFNYMDGVNAKKKIEECEQMLIALGVNIDEIG